MSGRWFNSRKYSVHKARCASGSSARLGLVQGGLQVPDAVLPVALGELGEHAVEPDLPGGGRSRFERLRVDRVAVGSEVERQEQAGRQGPEPRVVQPQGDTARTSAAAPRRSRS